MVDEVYHNLHHHVFLFRTALGNHQRECNKGIVSYTLATVSTIQYMIVVKEPQEQRSSNAFVAIAKGVVLCDEIEKHGSFLLNTGIKFLTTKGLVYLTYAALEGVIFLVAEER